MQSICKIFADDTKLYDNVSNQKQLQEDLLALIEWSNKWQLKFNLSKCIFLHIGNHNENTYMDKDRTLILKNVLKEKDVGVTFDSNLKFNSHICNIVKKANQLSGLIKTSFTFLDKDTFVKLFKALA